MDPLFINKEKIASLLPMEECIEVMEKAFRSLKAGRSSQPLRSLMWLPGKNGLMGMMPAQSSELKMMGIKVISVFPNNHEAGYPSHQGLVILFDSEHGQPLMIFDAFEITAIRTAAASALATRVLSRENSKRLVIIGAGEQAARHIEAVMLVRKIEEIRIWSRTGIHAKELAMKTALHYGIRVEASRSAEEAVHDADIICTVTASHQPVIQNEWIAAGTHINAVGACTPAARELDTATIVRSKLFADCYESLYKEAGDFIIPKNEGAIADDHVFAELGEVLEGEKKGRENEVEVTVFKSLGIAAEDLFSAWHIYEKLNNQESGR
jgi:alanine dehydrogenase